MSQMTEILMTQKQMMEALEIYLNEHVVKTPVVVSGVDKGAQPPNLFTIKLNTTMSPPSDSGATQ
jgi:hypothetical protein